MGVAATAHAGVSGAIAEQHHELTGLDGQKRAAVGTAAVGVGARSGNVGRAVGAVVVQEAAGQVQQALHRVGLHLTLAHARGIVRGHGLVAVGLADALHLGRDGVQGLFPRDFLELALAALAHALERLVQAIGALQPTADGAAAQAGAQLGLAQLGRAGVVGLDVLDLAILDVALQRAAAAAVHRAVRPDDGVGNRLAGIGQLAGALGGRRASEQRRGAHGGCAQTGQRRTLHERATRH